MITIQKIFILLALTATAGAATYEARQTSLLRERADGIRRQQAPLLATVQQLQEELNEATNGLASILAENQDWKSNFDAAEIQRLKAKLAGLQAAKSDTTQNPEEAELNAWLERVNQFKEYVEEHPSQAVPEFKFLTDREWLLIAASVSQDSTWDDAMQELKSQAEMRFAAPVEEALQKYAQANNSKFPGELSQLRPYCDPEVEDILQQRYEIKPASVLPASAVKVQNISTDWVIAGKKPIASNTGDRIAIYTGGYTYFW